MNVLYIGGGFVGTCSAAVSADSGHVTLVYDLDKEKVKKLSSQDRDIIKSCLHEEGLAELLIQNHNRITFTHDKEIVEKFIEDTDIVFMCLPTPEKKDAEGETDLSFYEKAVESIGPMLATRNEKKQLKHLVIVNKSTVPVRMIDYTEKLFHEQGVNNFSIVANPEFLVEGNAIKDSIHPDRVVVGANTEEDFIIMRQFYQRFYDSSTVQYIEVNPYEAACGKLLANFLLFNKIVTAYDVVGRTCEHFSNVNYEAVRKILISDPRIGTWGLYNSLFAGGSCFIKDAGSLAHQLEEAGAHAHLVREILEANVFQRDHFFSRAEHEAKFVWKDTKVAVLGLAFKQSTNDMRNSGAIGIIHELLGSGVSEVRVYDPAAMEEAKKYFTKDKNALYEKIVYASKEYDAVEDADVCIICTDWPQFRGIGDILLTLPGRCLIMDGRRILQHQYADLANAGFSIIAVGSPFIPGVKS
ncbi:MAG: UDP-glucose/GDP-mannose dehydrogenase family protein [Candidatus Magasanikbacteria bacterium]|nr:UDP-glucose/GDP-mannose dehydrogenase family protein [Candidatus Magasanikbacteria bacterium]